jgi:hypothetical protein
MFTLGVGPNQIKEFFPACQRYAKSINHHELMRITRVIGKKFVTN